MRLNCLICKREFKPSERFVQLTGQVVGHSGGIGQGVSLAVCAKHLSGEIIRALLLDTAGWSDHTHQVYAEKKVFDDKQEE